MKSFLEEYGFAILAAIVVILLIAMCTPVGNLIKQQILNMVDRFAGSADKKLGAADAGENTAMLAGGKLYVTHASSTDAFTYVIHGVKGGAEYVTASPVALAADDKFSKEADLATEVATLDAGSSYYVEVVNKGTGEHFFSNTLKK